MSITQGVTLLFLQDVNRGIHNFEGDTFRLALYNSSANLNAGTEFYTTANEVTGAPGYTAGGEIVNNFTIVVESGAVILTCDNVIWTSANITARGALLYNVSKGNRAVAVYNFGADRTSSGGDFTLIVPAATAAAGLIRYI